MIATVISILALTVFCFFGVSISNLKNSKENRDLYKLN